MAQFNRAVIFSGHMIDPPGRDKPRFPVECVPAVAASIGRQLARWGADGQTLAICGGAPGSDILFAEACLARGAHLRLLLPFSIEKFGRETFEGTPLAWLRRFEALLPRCEVLCQPDVLGPLLPGATAYERNNLWILDHGDIRSSIFPSGHVAVGFSAAFAMALAAPDHRGIAWTLLAIAALVWMNTIYGRYHYAADGLVALAASGASIGLVAAFRRVPPRAPGRRPGQPS